MFRIALLALLVLLPAASASAEEALSYKTLVTPLLCIPPA